MNDYETALNALHEQYEWAPQPVSTAGAALTRSNTTGGTLTHTQVPRLHRSISVSLAALTRTRAHAPCNPMREVRHMLDLCLVTGCYDWAALLATMLQSQRDLHAVLASAKGDREYCGGADHVVDKLRAVTASDIGYGCPAHSYARSNVYSINMLLVQRGVPRLLGCCNEEAPGS